MTIFRGGHFNWKKSALLLFAAIFLVAMGRRIMIVQIYGDSMSPTLNSGQWVMVWRGASGIKPGDLVLFVSPLDGTLAVKRCVLYGNTVPNIQHGQLITPWGEWFLSGSQWRALKNQNALPEDSFYMVGDNQFQSMDSRVYGRVLRSSILGRVIIRRSNG